MGRLAPQTRRGSHIEKNNPIHLGVYVALAAIAASVMCLIVASHQPNLLLGVVLRVIFEPVLFLSDFSVHLLFPREGVAPSRTEAPRQNRKRY
jgi:hypothetical protein